MTFTRTIVIAAASLLIATPVFAQASAQPTGKSDMTPSGAMKEGSAGANDKKMRDGMTSGRSEETPSTAGATPNAEKKM